MRFIWPTDTKRVTSKFRTKERPDHHGTDIAEGGARPIYAIADGTVSKSYTSSSYGEVVFIVHKIGGQTWESVYAHMRKGSRGFNEGDKVKQGTQIGVMGNTGHSYGQHLHIELHKGRWNINKTNAVDPLDYLGVEDKKLETYKIKSGDTFWGLEEKFDLKHGTLAKLNPSLDPNALQIGQVINLREKVSAIPVKGRIKIEGTKYGAAFIVDRPSSTNSENLGVIEDGEEINIAGSIPGWWEVIYEGERAYVNAKFARRVK